MPEENGDTHEGKPRIDGANAQEWCQSSISMPKMAQEPKERIFLIEQCGNVYENKGPPWKTRGRSGNVYENTGT